MSNSAGSGPVRGHLGSCQVGRRQVACLRCWSGTRREKGRSNSFERQSPAFASLSIIAAECLKSSARDHDSSLRRQRWWSSARQTRKRITRPLWNSKLLENELLQIVVGLLATCSVRFEDHASNAIDDRLRDSPGDFRRQSAEIFPDHRSKGNGSTAVIVNPVTAIHVSIFSLLRRHEVAFRLRKIVPNGGSIHV